MNIYYRIIGIKVEALGTKLVVDTNKKNAKDVYEFLKQYDGDIMEWVLLPCRFTSSSDDEQDGQEHLLT